MTTAFVEGLNSLFSASKRKARRYCSTEYQVTMLYLVPGKVPKVSPGLIWSGAVNQLAKAAVNLKGRGHRIKYLLARSLQKPEAI